MACHSDGFVGILIAQLKRSGFIVASISRLLQCWRINSSIKRMFSHPILLSTDSLILWSLLGWWDTFSQEGTFLSGEYDGKASSDFKGWFYSLWPLINVLNFENLISLKKWNNKKSVLQNYKFWLSILLWSQIKNNSDSKISKVDSYEELSKTMCPF